MTIHHALQDKMGPFCRAASDCALILDILRGRDMDDIASQDVPLPNPFNVDVSNLSIGVLPSMQDSSAEVSHVKLLPCMSLHGSQPCRYKYWFVGSTKVVMVMPKLLWKQRPLGELSHLQIQC